MNQDQAEASCTCGRAKFPVTGKPILRARCYCTSCRTAGMAFAQDPDAPSVVGDDGGTDLMLYRKDRVGPITGGDLLQEHRLTPTSPTRRVVATCCNTPIFLEFTNGHWLSVYAGRLSGALPPLDMRVMTIDRLEQSPLPPDVPNYERQSAGFMWKLLTAWAAIGFRRPKVAW